jgi:hypothetical protein
MFLSLLLVFVAYTIRLRAWSETNPAGIVVEENDYCDKPRAEDQLRGEGHEVNVRR